MVDSNDSGILAGMDLDLDVLAAFAESGPGRYDIIPSQEDVCCTA